MTGLIAFFPFRMVAPDQINNILFCLDVGDTDKIIDLSVTDLTPVFPHIK